MKWIEFKKKWRKKTGTEIVKGDEYGYELYIYPSEDIDKDEKIVKDFIRKFLVENMIDEKILDAVVDKRKDKIVIHTDAILEETEEWSETELADYLIRKFYNLLNV